MQKLSTISLFSGIGGIEIGLRSITDPVLYCEKDKVARDMLLQNMKWKQIGKAKVHEDVTSLKPKLMGLARVDLVTGGFPCQGISMAGAKLGLKDPRSRLFFEMMRVARESNARFVFLENVDRLISTPDIQVVAKELIRSGYTKFAWVTIKANEVGSPVYRTRWFCLALRDDMVPPSKVKYDMSQLHKWAKGEPVQRRMKVGQSSREYHECKRFGNAVVPFQVSVAWNTLVNLLSLKDSVHFRPIRGSLQGRSIVMYQKGKFYTMSSSHRRKYLDFYRKLDFGLIIDPKYRKIRETVESCKRQSEASTTSGQSPEVTRPVKMTHWPSPRFGNISIGCRLSERTLRCVGIVGFERRTPDSTRIGKITKEWLSWLMGYSFPKKEQK